MTVCVCVPRVEKVVPLFNNRCLIGNRKLPVACISFLSFVFDFVVLATKAIDQRGSMDHASLIRTILTENKLCCRLAVKLTWSQLSG